MQQMMDMRFWRHADARALSTATLGHRESLHHEARQSPSLICHWAHVRMWLRFELGVFLPALRVDTNLTDSKGHVPSYV